MTSKYKEERPLFISWRPNPNGVWPFFLPFFLRGEEVGFLWFLGFLRPQFSDHRKSDHTQRHRERERERERERAVTIL